MTELFIMFTNPVVLKIVVIALTVGVLISLCASLLGVSLVLKRYSMIGDGLSHVGYGALAIASALKLGGEYRLEVSLPIVVAAAFLLLKLGSSTKINSDAAIAMFSTVSIAIGTILFSLSGGTAGDACNSLFGSASLITVTTKDMWLSIILCAVVIAVFVLLYHRLFAVTFDEKFMTAVGVNSGAYNLLLALLTAVTIVLGMQMMGAIMISGLIIFPPLSAMRVCNTFKSVIVVSGIISVICFVVGFITACVLQLQTGPVVIVANFVAYILIGALSALRAKNNR